MFWFSSSSNSITGSFGKWLGQSKFCLQAGHILFPVLIQWLMQSQWKICPQWQECLFANEIFWRQIGQFKLLLLSSLIFVVWIQWVIGFDIDNNFWALEFFLFFPNKLPWLLFLCELLGKIDFYIKKLF